MVDYILAAFERNENVIARIFDVSKGFDCGPHSGLAYKLEKRGVSSFWKISPLSERYQTVWANGKFSDLSEVTHGVGQGSIIGTLIF